MKKRILSALLALSLCLTLLPTVAFADEGTSSEPTTPTRNCATEGHINTKDKAKCDACGVAIVESGTWEDASDEYPDRLYGSGTWSLSADGTLTVLNGDTVLEVTDNITTGIYKNGNAVTTVTGETTATVTTEGNGSTPKTTVVYQYNKDIKITVTSTVSVDEDTGIVTVTTAPSVAADGDGYEVVTTAPSTSDSKTTYVFYVKKDTSGGNGSTSTGTMAIVTVAITPNASSAFSEEQVAITVTKPDSSSTSASSIASDPFKIATTAFIYDKEKEKVSVTTQLSKGAGENEKKIAKTQTDVYTSGDKAGTIYGTTTSTTSTDDEDEDIEKKIYGQGALPTYQSNEETPWFNCLTSAKKIVIGEGITNTGSSSFSGCFNVTEVILPDSLTQIGTYAFGSCHALTTICIPKAVTTIEDGAFSDCIVLEAFEVDADNPYFFSEDGVLFRRNTDESDESGSDSGTTLTKLAEEAGESAAESGSNSGTTLICYPPGKTDTSYAIPEGVTTIFGEAFRAANRLTELSLPASLTLISRDVLRNVLYGCSNLTTITVDKDNPTYKDIDGVLFSKDGTILIYYPKKKAGSSYTIPGGVTTIGEAALLSVEALTSVTIPESVITIEYDAFTACFALSEVTIPASVTDISPGAFNGCTSLTAIHVAKGNNNYKDIDGVLFSKDGKTLCYCPITKTGGYTVPNGVETIVEYAFSQSNLTSVSFPNGVKTIKDYAFLGAENLASVSLPSTVKEMGVFVFNACNVLKNVYFAGSKDNWSDVNILDKGRYFADDEDTNTCLGIDETVTTIHYAFEGDLTVTLNANGGTLPADAQTKWTIQYHETIPGEPPTPTRSGYSFAGWTYTMQVYDPNINAYPTVTRVWNWGDPVYTDLNLTAAWVSDDAATYSITVAQTQNGTVTIRRKSAEAGDVVSFTVKPDEGYTLDTLTVCDRNGREIALTDKGGGQYTFKMPASKVTLTATFAPEETEVPEVPVSFVDVAPDAYYYEAVLWATENEITTGVDETHFGPDLACTRAQLVTFLWRAAGCPEPKAASGFTDVPADAYYEKAVAWAVESGITTGVGDARFSPDRTCTRAETVTFLFRYAAASGMDSMTGQELVSGFVDAADVPSYALSAFNWALVNGIVQGANDCLLPQNPCTRAQFVTMLYRLSGEAANTLT